MVELFLEILIGVWNVAFDTFPLLWVGVDAGNYIRFMSSCVAFVAQMMEGKVRIRVTLNRFFEVLLNASMIHGGDFVDQKIAILDVRASK
jgi:hypothetical protein